MRACIIPAPRSTDEAYDRDWQARSECFTLAERAQAKLPEDEDPGELAHTVEYWFTKFPMIPERTRESIVTIFDGLIDPMRRRPLRDLLCSRTTITPEATFEGKKIIVVDLPIKQFNRVGFIAQAIWKRMWQRAVEARDINAFPRPVFLWADEAQNFITSHDRDFQATARSQRACTVYLTQNLPNYLSALAGPDAKSVVDAFMGCFQTKVFHANTCSVTNQWASDTIARSWQTRASVSRRDPGGSGPDGKPADEAANRSFSSVMEHDIPPGEFTTLAKGGPANNRRVEAVTIVGGRRFEATGKNWIRCRFTQPTRGGS